MDNKKELLQELKRLVDEMQTGLFYATEHEQNSLTKKQTINYLFDTLTTTAKNLEQVADIVDELTQH